jgi:peptide/nickel transport system permease protein
MAFTFTFLWTDIIFYLLIISVIGLCFWQNSHGHKTWRLVWCSRVGMSTSVILFFYILIALLDSIHIRLTDAIQVQSVLDIILSPLDKPLEKTYIPPLYGVSLENIVSVIISVIPLILCVWLLFIAVIYRVAGKYLWQQDICWPTLIFTMGIMLFVMMSLYALSRDYHIFGTDKIGQDVFYQAVKSIRTGIMIGTLTTIVMLPFALLMGTMAGYFRGWIDDVIQYIYTTLSSIPSVLLIAASVLMLEVFMGTHPEWFVNTLERADARLLALCIILGITSWTSLCRLVRAETLKLRELDYVMAAKALGVKDFGIILKHILPNLMHIILITIVLDFSGLVLAEAVLSYIGVGVDPSMQSFGNMINSARLELAQEPVVWWSLTAAFIFMFVLVLAANLFADTVRDALDPKLQ